MGNFKLRLATTADMDQIMVIIRGAQTFIAKQGFDQWQDGYPAQADMLADIKASRLYVLANDTQIAAVAAAIVGVDPNYRLVETGSWLMPSAKYAAIHRVAVSSQFRGQHLAETLFTKLMATLKHDQDVVSVRVDTHKQNQVLQHVVQKVGFEYCGHIYIDGNAQRLAYECVLK
ncbi:GNAT family N-acetyltransferase [Furfurilactobacillus milii]|uniref:GNAT family N-acetyltransferase n=1 Tax=Furfurilactobacillus rossiae TaxID=231049 RepID=A0A7C9JCE7_9LACO|nr:GNAT family N-acetyltransferase [Furfurilactobacillus milii]MYV04473.1 GNAT family N-acetyltransferase [Furfurilactobacillus milii]